MSIVPNRAEISIVLDDDYTKLLYSQTVPVTLPQRRKSPPSDFSKRVYQLPVQICSNFSQRKPAKHLRTSRNKMMKQNLYIVSKKNPRRQRRHVLASGKNLQLTKVNTPSVINHLS